MSPTGDRCGDLCFGFIFGVGCIAGGFLTDTAPLAAGGVFVAVLCLTALVIVPAKRNRHASHDLSALNREDERIAWEQLYGRKRRAG